MSGRGRRAGYNNYSVHDQLLLCQLAEAIVPLGRNMWEQLAVRYNASRTRNSPERDFESLRRKFKSLYTKSKPTGQGEVPARLRPVVWAQEIQQKIEETCGVQTSHDGQDGGEDDDTFEAEVNAVLGPPPVQHPAPDAAGGISGAEDAESGGAGAGGGDRVEPDAEDSVSDAALNVFESDTAPEDSFLTPDAITQCAQRSDAADPSSRATGAIVTASGVVDVRLAAEFGLSDDEETNEDENHPEEEAEAPATGATSRQESSEAGYQGCATGAAIIAHSNPSSARLLISTTAMRDKHDARERLPRTPRRTTTSTRPTTGGNSVRAGRPRTQSVQHIPTMASHHGRELQRNPGRMTAEEREENENRSLNVASNRLGGQDLRVVRDNIEALTQSFLNENGKRSPAESAKNDNSVSFAKTKRIRMQQRLDDMQKDMDDAESRRSSSTGEMMKLLMFFQKDSERRAEAEERRRRIERDEHLEAERRERAERELVRREEAEAAEKKRMQEVQIARENREEQRRSDAERDAKLDREREENRRQFEERLALERSEARQRHEQMLMLLSTLQKK